MTSADKIDKALARRHPSGPWLCFRELRLGSGYRGISGSRLDFYALATAPSAGCRAVAYEIKVSRSDFLRDVKAPLKQKGARLYSNEFYYATPRGLVKPEEIPDWAGLIECWSDTWQPYSHLPPVDRFESQIVVPAPHREKARPSWPLLVAFLRREWQVRPDVVGVSA